MTSTLSDSPGLRHPEKLFIGGRWCDPSTGTRIDVISPATEELMYRVAAAGPADVDRAVAAARSAFDEGPWPSLAHEERAGYLRLFADAIEDRSDAFARLWSGQMGVLYSISRARVPAIAEKFRRYADLAKTFPFIERHHPDSDATTGLLVREPVGVVGAIIPWNGPLALAAHKSAPALLAGCSVVLKASPEAPGEALLLAEIAEEIGLPPGVFNVLTADREVSELLVRDPRVDKITFTGSTAAGRKIAGICGERLARCTLELGGKSAAVILDDFDLEQAAAVLTAQACYMSGQVCASLSRVVVTRKRHDAMVEALAARTRGVRLGDPFDPDTTLGPLVSGRQRDRVESYVAGAVDEGGQVAAGGRRPDRDKGFYVAPTIIGRVGNHTRMGREEVFGPVLSVIVAADEDDAVAIANDTPYGLNNSVFTNDPDRAYAVARKLRSGTVGHNALRVDFDIAFGGFKQSGIGREGGREGLLPFLETKTIVLNAEPAESGLPA